MSKINEALNDLHETIEQAGTPYFLVDFYAPWCGPCRQLMPALQKLAPHFKGKVTFGKVNIDENQELAVALDISGLPTIKVYHRDGDGIREIYGNVGVPVMKELIEFLDALPVA